MSTLFIADLHLQPCATARTNAFLRFLRQQAARAEALYILGDLFEVWIGDDDLQPLHRQVAQALRQLPVPCYFIAGNRDFLLGPAFAAASQLILLPDLHFITLYQVPTLILHGDTLCTQDRDYQRLRYALRQPWLQRRFLSLPLAWRQSIAQRLRHKSVIANQQKSQAIMEVNPAAVIDLIAQYGALRLIHGHTHHAKQQRISVPGEQPGVERHVEHIVLGAWEQQASVVQIDVNGAQQREFAF